MLAPLPDPAVTRRSIEIYLRCAYESAPPAWVAKLLQSLPPSDDESYFLPDAFEKDVPEDTGRWSLRLGNSHYPFMKLRIDRRPDAGGFLYEVDTHDMHIAPAMGSPEFHEFQALMRANQTMAIAIELAWGEAGIPTFKSWLAADLARRRSEVQE
jgi:hypothetical protein